MYLLQIPLVHTPGIPVLWRLRQGDLEFEARVGYTVRCCLKNQNETKPRAFHLLCKYSPSGLPLTLTPVFKFL